MNLGIITGRRIGKNRDSDVDRLLLQVQMHDEDVRTVELVSLSGEDVNPADGCRAVVVTVNGVKLCVAITDDLTPEVDPGEREIYSTDNPATTKKARIKLGADEVVTINQGTKSAVTWEELNNVLQILVTAINGAFAAKLDGGGSNPGLTLDITSAQCTEVKLP